MNNQTESKLKPLFLENPFEKKLEQLDTANFKRQHQTKLDKMFRPKTFEERWHFSNLMAIMVGYICNYFSSITAFSLIFFLIYLSASPVFGPIVAGIIAFIPAFALVVAIELVKRHASANFLQDVIQFKKFNPGMLAFLTGCCLFSITTSFIGGRELPKHLPILEVSNFKNLYSQDSLLDLSRAEHSKIIATQRVRVDSFKFQNTNSKGSIRYGAIEAVGVLEKQLTDMINDSRFAFRDIRKQYNQDVQNAKDLDLNEQQVFAQENTQLAFLLSYSAICAELLFLLCMTAHWWYSWTCQKERHTNIPQESSNDSSNDSRNSDPPGPSGGHQRTGIGFKQGNTDDNRTDDNRTSIILPKCTNCSREFLPRHHKQQYCKESCRIEAWEKRTGKKFKKLKKT